MDRRRSAPVEWMIKIAQKARAGSAAAAMQTTALTTASSSSSALSLYAPLAKAHDIRILHLAPSADPHDQLSARLEVVSLADLPTYDALSYTHDSPFKGDFLPDDFIYISGLPGRIGGNLGNALRRLRDPEHPRALWIDTICVDRSNVMEHNAQVAITAGIFRTAERVILWLGEDSDLKDGEFVYTMATGLTPSAKGRRKRDSPLQSVMPDFDEDASNIEELSEKFLSRRTFQRRWTIAELTHATVVDVVCGAMVLPWIAFFRALQVMLHHRRLHESDNWQFGTRLQMLEDLRQGRANQAGRKTFTAVEILCSFSNLGCHDPCDRLYSLACLWDLGFLKIDYSKTPEEIYHSLAQSIATDSIHSHRPNDPALIHVNQMLLVAAYQAGDRWRMNAQLQASWMPDWRFVVPERISEPFTTNIIQPVEVKNAVTLKANVPVLGTIDTFLTGDSLKLLMPRGARTADLKEMSDYQWAFEQHCPTLRTGDMLCTPILKHRLTDCRLAIVVRAAVQERVMKGCIVGMFPVDIFGAVPGLEETMVVEVELS